MYVLWHVYDVAVAHLTVEKTGRTGSANESNYDETLFTSSFRLSDKLQYFGAKRGYA